MMDKQDFQFDGMETMLVKEAIHNAGRIYLEEVLRATSFFAGDHKKAAGFVGEAMAHASTINYYLIGSEKALEEVWVQLRSQSQIFDVVMRTTVKLRGMYSDDNWNAITEQQVAGLSFMALAGSMGRRDESVAEHHPAQGQWRVDTALNANPWFTTLMLVNYAPVNSTYPELSAVLKDIAAKKTEAEKAE